MVGNLEVFLKLKRIPLLGVLALPILGALWIAWSEPGRAPFLVTATDALALLTSVMAIAWMYAVGRAANQRVEAPHRWPAWPLHGAALLAMLDLAYTFSARHPDSWFTAIAWALSTSVLASYIGFQLNRVHRGAGSRRLHRIGWTLLAAALYFGIIHLQPIVNRRLARREEAKRA